MNGLTHVMFHRSQRALRALLLVAMAWLLGASGLTHTHAGTPLRPAAAVLHTAVSADQPTVAAASADEDCAICWWKARTPYVSPEVHPDAVVRADTLDYHVARPRAPPAGATERPRTRAPPTRLS